MRGDHLSSLALMHVHHTFDIGMEGVIGAYRNGYKLDKKTVLKSRHLRTSLHITLSMLPIMHIYATVLVWIHLIGRLIL